jgi:hypothetical protein
MLTAILLAYDAPARQMRRDAVSRSLGALVEACVEGLVADAALVGPPERGLGVVADDAGCALVEAVSAEDGLREALGLARHDGVLLLLAGYAPERGFVDEVHDALLYGDRATALVLRAGPHSFFTRLAPRLAAPAGIVASKAAMVEAGSADLAILAKKLKGADLLTRARKVV